MAYPGGERGPPAFAPPAELSAGKRSHSGTNRPSNTQSGRPPLNGPPPTIALPLPLAANAGAGVSTIQSLSPIAENPFAAASSSQGAARPQSVKKKASVDKPTKPSLRITIAKKKFSLNRRDSLMIEMTEHPSGRQDSDSENKADQPPKKTPSSKGTVLTMAGLFIVGLTLVFSGILVLFTQTAIQFRITAGVFIGLGSLFLIISIILQRKNVVKYVTEMEQDYFFFLNITGNPIWKLMFQDIDVSPASKRPRME